MALLHTIFVYFNVVLSNFMRLDRVAPHTFTRRHHDVTLEMSISAVCHLVLFFIAA